MGSTEATMDAPGPSEKLETDLRQALQHLYDPLYRPAQSLWGLLGVNRLEGIESLQVALIREVESMEHPASAPAAAPIRRYQKLLRLRYVQGLKQEVAARRVGLSARHFRTQERNAIRALTIRLLGRSATTPPADLLDNEDRARPAAAVASDQESLNWISQIHVSILIFRIFSFLRNIPILESSSELL